VILAEVSEVDISEAALQKRYQALDYQVNQQNNCPIQKFYKTTVNKLKASIVPPVFYNHQGTMRKIQAIYSEGEMAL